MLRAGSLTELSEDEFTRKVGLPRSCFITLLSLIESKIKLIKQDHPLKRRGRKSALKVEDKLLLTLYYIRHYPTFDILADMFSAEIQLRIRHPGFIMNRHLCTYDPQSAHLQIAG